MERRDKETLCLATKIIWSGEIKLEDNRRVSRIRKPRNMFTSSPMFKLLGRGVNQALREDSGVKSGLWLASASQCTRFVSARSEWSVWRALQVKAHSLETIIFKLSQGLRTARFRSFRAKWGDKLRLWQVIWNDFEVKRFGLHGKGRSATNDTHLLVTNSWRLHLNVLEGF
jgi:hypothetical protein